MTCGLCSKMIAFGEDWAHVKRDGIMKTVHIRCVERETYNERYERELTPKDRELLEKMRIAV